jgi:hypothetical protein
VVFPNIAEKNPHHINVIEQIIFLYGREILDEIRDLEKLGIKIKRRVSDLVSLLSFSIYIKRFSMIFNLEFFS